MSVFEKESLCASGKRIQCRWVVRRDDRRTHNADELAFLDWGNGDGVVSGEEVPNDTAMADSEAVPLVQALPLGSVEICGGRSGEETRSCVTAADRLTARVSSPRRLASCQSKNTRAFHNSAGCAHPSRNSAVAIQSGPGASGSRPRA